MCAEETYLQHIIKMR
jgi:hypothetical protein